jgi:hypothetical protein
MGLGSLIFQMRDSLSVLVLLLTCALANAFASSLPDITQGYRLQLEGLSAIAGLYVPVFYRFECLFMAKMCCETPNPHMQGSTGR